MPYETPTVGTECYYSCGSDRYPTTIVAVTHKGKHIQTRDAEFKRTDNNGFSESQEYTFKANPNGQLTEWTWRRTVGGADGCYVRKGEPARGGMRLTIGYGYKAHWDPHF